MSSIPPHDWENKLLKSKKGELPTKEQKSIIYSFSRKDIFEHSYCAEDLFNHIYKQDGKAKRQPNTFMIFRAVFGKIAAEKNIKIGDGTQQSKLAGFIWGSASRVETTAFENLCKQFRKLHKRRFPEYEYKPQPRTSKFGSVVDIKTAIDYQDASPVVNDIYYGIPFETYPISMNEYSFSNFPNEIDIQTSEFDGGIVMEGYQTNQTNRPLPTIAVNCIFPEVNEKKKQPIQINDPNNSQMTPINAYGHPFNPSSTFTSSSW